MKKQFITSLVLSFISFDSYSKQAKLIEETVIDQIKKTLSKNHGVKKTFWNEPKKAKRKVLNKRKTNPFSKKTFVNKKSNIKGDWMSSKMNESRTWQKKKIDNTKKWKQEKLKLVNKWFKEKSKYHKRIPVYKKNLYSFGAIKKENIKIRSHKNVMPINKNKPYNKYSLPKIIMVPGAFTPEVLDQGRRPTCSAFAATRAVSILLSNKGNKQIISPQYIYFASKPKCQSSPCNKKGSWPRAFFERSLNSKKPDIPTLKDCPYNSVTVSKNETQLPLQRGCFSGKFKITGYSQTRSFNEIKESLKNGYPVIGGVRLSPNFYKNKGVVLYKDSGKTGKMDSHSAGHAILFVGYMKIPPSLNEGPVCLITSNSWGPGWGVGGHSCLSERWIKEHSFDIPFLSLNSVR